MTTMMDRTRRFRAYAVESWHWNLGYQLQPFHFDSQYRAILFAKENYPEGWRVLRVEVVCTDKDNEVRDN